MKEKMQMGSAVHSEDESSEIIVIKNACPLCGSDVKGNDRYKFYCKRCNILFDKAQLDLEGEKKTTVEKEEIIRKGEQRKEKGKKEKAEEGKENKAFQDKTLQDKALQENVFVSSAKSDKYHLKNCPFAQRIAQKNKLLFKNSKEAEEKGYKPCACTLKK